MAAALAALAASGAQPATGLACVAALAVYIGGAANDWRCRGLERRGRRLVAVVAGRDADDAAALPRTRRVAGPVTVAIVDYGSGNLRSAAKAFERAAADAPGRPRVEVTADAAALARAHHIVLPGVGAFVDCMTGLSRLPGMVAALRERADAGVLLGICVGMQLMATTGRGARRPPRSRLGPGRVVPIPSAGHLRIPHMGWNEVEPCRDHPVLAGIGSGTHAYFVHSYTMIPDDPGDVLAVTDYGGRISAVIGRDNVLGTQFHPEKSQRAGLALISRFLAWRP